MYRTILCCLLLFSLTSISKSQTSEGGIPHSFALTGLKSSEAIPVVSLQTIDIEQFLSEESSNPEPFRYAVFTDTLIDIKIRGKEELISEKGNLWRLRIDAANAKSIQLMFETFIIPKGASLFLYDDSHSLLAGAFTKKNVRRDSSFIIADFKGSHVNIEYFEPVAPEFEGKVVIGSISQAYKDILTSRAGEVDYISVNCPIGENAQLPKHAVCKMSFRSGAYSALCSGALINNVKQDGTPYFLTAHHCISVPDEAASLVTYFNYEVAGCNGEDLTPLTISGSELLSTIASSDYTLLLLSETPGANYQPFYAGWDSRDSVTSYVTAIHHPEGYTKKISIDYDTIYSNPSELTWDDNSVSPPLSHWVLGFDDGATGGGSSGSPLFNSNNQIIGQLHGGTETIELFGKLSYSFAHKPGNYPAISHYLDPDTTGAPVLGGYSPDTNIPDAFFSTRFSQVCINSSVVFRDRSVFGPYERKWSVNSPENYAFVEGTSDTSANPVIAFNSRKDFIVTLDLLLSDTIASSESFLMVADSTINVSLKTKADDVLCDCDFNTLKFSASGAEDYLWRIVPEDLYKATLDNDSGDIVYVNRNPDFHADSAYTLDLIVVGTQGNCTDTVKVSYDILKPVNDEIASAILLNYGKSDTYSNVCATIEEGEPIPPFESCTSQDSWCDELGTGLEIVKNSVWFRFVASQTGLVSISSSGFDNQIALYEAASYQNILAGEYTLLAANDDRSLSNYRPLIISESVIPGETYWIQVDGSAGNLVDNFYLTILELTLSGVEDQSSRDGLMIYPQPAINDIYIKGNGLTSSSVHISVFSASGLCVLNKDVPVNHDEINLSIASWDSGIYIVKIVAGDRSYFGRIVKR